MMIEELQRSMVQRLKAAQPTLEAMPAGDLSVELIVHALAPWAPSQWHGLIAAAVLKQLEIDKAIDAADAAVKEAVG